MPQKMPGMGYGCRCCRLAAARRDLAVVLVVDHRVDAEDAGSGAAGFHRLQRRQRAWELWRGAEDAHPELQACGERRCRSSFSADGNTAGRAGQARTGALRPGAAPPRQGNLTSGPQCAQSIRSRAQVEGDGRASSPSPPPTVAVSSAFSMPQTPRRGVRQASRWHKGNPESVGLVACRHGGGTRFGCGG
jgi:hypothetical protein